MIEETYLIQTLLQVHIQLQVQLHFRSTPFSFNSKDQHQNYFNLMIEETYLIQILLQVQIQLQVHIHFYSTQQFNTRITLIRWSKEHI